MLPAAVMHTNTMIAGLQTRKPNSGIGVERSLPRDLENQETRKSLRTDYILSAAAVRRRRHLRGRGRAGVCLRVRVIGARWFRKSAGVGNGADS
jgi:hypothetical protein